MNLYFSNIEICIMDFNIADFVDTPLLYFVDACSHKFDPNQFSISNWLFKHSSLYHDLFTWAYPYFYFINLYFFSYQKCLSFLLISYSIYGFILNHFHFVYHLKFHNLWSPNFVFVLDPIFHYLFLQVLFQTNFIFRLFLLDYHLFG